MLNRICLQGRLVRDPSRKETNSGTVLCDFSIAVQRNQKGSDGQYPSDFFDCVAWRGAAEFVAGHFAKGDMIVVDGRMQSESYQNKEGQNRTRWTVQVDNVNFCDSGSRNTTAAETVQSDEPAPETQQSTSEDPGELPFEV